MVKIILFSIVLLFSTSMINSQNRIGLNVGYGYYLINSENSTKIMGDKIFQSFVLYDFSFQKDSLLGFNLLFEYSYQQITKKNIIEFVRYEPGPFPAPPPYWGNMKLISHNFDLDYTAKINNYLSYGIGPSFIIVNRILEVDTVLYDKLASSGLGINGFTECSVPIYGSKKYFFFTSKLKFRYTHSIWFDKGIRNLDDYKQEYFTVHILAGIGYAF